MSTDHQFDYRPADKISDPDLFGKFKHQWVEENFSALRKNDEEVRIAETKSFLGCSLPVKKTFILLVIMVVGTIIIFARCFYLQAVRGDYYRALAENNRVRIKPTPSERGLIYDRQGRQLTENIPSFSLSVVPQDLPQNAEEKQVVIEQIAQISGVNEKEISELIKKYSAYSFESLTIKDNLDYESALTLYIKNANLPGIVIEKGTKRLYKTTLEGANEPITSLSHIIGYLGKIDDDELKDFNQQGYLPSDYLGKTGIEKQYESLLRGSYGRKKIEVNALGREQNILAEEAPIPGKNLVLSIDAEAQNKLEELMQTTLRRNKWGKAAGIALNPQTGDILALVSLPAYDNNNFSGGISVEKYYEYTSDENKPLFNRAISGGYPSGSIIKPLIAAAALQEGIINKNTTFLSTGGLEVDKWFFRDWKAGGHGLTNVTKAIAWSVNTFFYYIGGGYKSYVGLGADKIVEYLKKFQVSEKTGIDLPGEYEGFLPSKAWKEETKNEIWYVGDTYNLSIGQGDLLVTPLQAAVWTAAVSNGGRIIKPRLVTSIINPVNNEKASLPNESRPNGSISVANINIAKQGMRECVSYGSCQLLQGLNFTSGAKTGTAQWSKNKKEHAWFTAFAPYNQPKIVITILIEEGGEGSTASMPIAYEFLKWWGNKYIKN